jgi:hypothetical protein
MPITVSSVKGQVPFVKILSFILRAISSAGPKNVSPNASPTARPRRDVLARSSLLVLVIICGVMENLDAKIIGTTAYLEP